MVSVVRWTIEGGKYTHWPKSCRYVNKTCNQGETKILLGFNWSSGMMVKMGNSEV